MVLSLVAAAVVSLYGVGLGLSGSGGRRVVSGNFWGGTTLLSRGFFIRL